MSPMLTDKTDKARTRWRDAHIYSKMEGRMKRAGQSGCSEVGVEWARLRFCSDVTGGDSVYGGALQGGVE